jgi:DNA-binding response OmpR family regulator
MLIMQDRILIIDDDLVVQNMLAKIVKSNHYEPYKVTSGEQALAILSQQTFDMILLDINMNGMDGFEFLQKIRESGLDVPVIIISGRKEDFDTVYGFDIGADDYVTKPFNPITLGAKIKAILRRRKGDAKKDSIIVGPFKYHTATLRFYKNNAEIPLSSKENALMKLFMDNVNRVFSKNSLYELIWDDTIVNDNTIMVYINHLRKKIEDDPQNPQYIQTIRGLGYRFTY